MARGPVGATDFRLPYPSNSKLPAPYPGVGEIITLREDRKLNIMNNWYYWHENQHSMLCDHPAQAER
ncbi:hypothetical protein MCOR25_007927 [Pyricularia grisea]|uniref:Uncharacterized protein n=1 Tax=Pyricularia grisea TaxID=148305 RepID=A0A6P8BJK7_PYRGI|nr:uncharacterized protein PgNI_02152 [Pyricularia grisea]KAI6356237.1 hypothetical protein MCOR25_007927 [Pyricularia grisea]TLD16757.1 hypothetical protein PgNI_02152 [Pyricularia grisea]